MCVHTGVIHLLLLCFAAVFGAPVQDPAPQGEPDLNWDGDTEDAYRRALHLWQVRGKPDEAAEILLGLADQSAVTQVPGQASWVLVLGAQALTEAGRGEEAAALIPGIERGARGSALEEFVLKELNILRSAIGVESDGLDPAFQKYFYDTLVNSEGSRSWMADKYGRALLPYILDAMESWRNAQASSSLVQQALDLGWRIANRQYIDALLREAEQMTPLGYLSVFGGAVVEGDLTAREESLRFWIVQCGHSEKQRASRARFAVASFLLKVHPEADQLILKQALAQDPQFLDLLLTRLERVRSESARAILLEIQRMAPKEQARRARVYLAAFGLEEVAAFAASGEMSDVARYLAGIAWTRLQNISARGSNMDLLKVLEELEATCETGRYLPEVRQERSRESGWSPPPVPGWRGPLDVPEALLDMAEMRSLLALAAVGLNDSDALDRALASGPPHYPELLMRLIGAYEGPMCATLWRDLEIYAKMADRGDLEDLIEAHADEVNSERARLIHTIYPDFTGWSSVFYRWAQQGRVEDLRSLLLDAALPWRIRSQAAGKYVNTGAIAGPELLTELLNGWQSLGDEDRRFLVSAIRTLYYVGQDRIHQQDQRSVLELFYAVSTPCDLIRHLLGDTDAGSWNPVLSFITDESRADWILGHMSASPGAPQAVIAMMRAGSIHPEFLANESGPWGWIQPGTQQSLEAVRIFLQSTQPEYRVQAAIFLRRDQSAYLALQRDLEPLWSDPAVVGWLALTAAEHSRVLDPAERLLGAWKMERIENRSLILRAMINTANPRFVPALLAAISDPDDKVAATARDGLQRLKEIEEQRAFWESWQATGVGGSPTAALLRQIRSENKEIRLSAIRALGAVKAPEALPLLISLLDHADPEVVAAARAALKWLAEESPPK